MFPGCPEHCNPERISANFPGILRAGWAVTVFLVCIYTMLIGLSHTNIYLETKAGVLHSIT